ncbi:hypothetical protein BJV74DRAFT_879520 [Russula compacta]|nr:hypothetical protein BJV74DRAFT_879520 [Russula compacta]
MSQSLHLSSGFIVGEAPREAFLLGKKSRRGVLAGAPFVDEIFRLLECIVEWRHIAEGDELAIYLLLGERVVLNLLARCIGFAITTAYYGRLVGNIDPHRFNLSMGGFSFLLDVEVRDEDETDEAIAAGTDVIMLDDIESNEPASVAQRLRECWMSEGKKFLLETSGGITDSNLRERAIAEIAILRTSSVHRSVPHIDFSFDDPDASQVKTCNSLCV